MYCKNCKISFSEDFKICPQCGRELISEESRVSPEPDLHFVKIAVVNNAMEGNILTGLLQENGFAVLTSGNMMQGIYPVNVNGLGKVRILVPEQDVKDAVLLISDHEDSNEFNKCDNCGFDRIHIWHRYCINCGSEIDTNSVIIKKYKKIPLNQFFNELTGCPFCKNPLPIDSKYCPTCGEKQE